MVRAARRRRSARTRDATLPPSVAGASADSWSARGLAEGKAQRNVQARALHERRRSRRRRGGQSNSRGIEAGALRGHLGKLVALENRDGTSLQANHSMLDPGTQLLIRPLARFAYDLADLALGDRDLASRRGCLCIVGKAQQGFCQIYWQTEERQFLHLLAGVA